MTVFRTATRIALALPALLAIGVMLPACPGPHVPDDSAADVTMDAADATDATVLDNATDTMDATDVAVYVVPEETADDTALAALADWRSLPVFDTRRAILFSSYDRNTGAPAPLPILANGNRDVNNFLCASAQAQALPAAIPYQFDMPACAESYVRGFVMARAEGSGQLARLWLTALSLNHGGALTTELLRVYVDDNTAPLLEIPLAAALDGSAGEIFAPPFGAGTSAYLAWYYPVVFSRKLIISIDRLTRANHYYYQANVILDATARPRSPSPARLPARDVAASLLRATETGPITGTVQFLPETPLTVAAGTSTPIADLTGPGTIHALRFVVPNATWPSLDSMSLEARWDDASILAIDVPLSELFASALAPASTASLALSGSAYAGEHIWTLRLPMPFASHAVLQLTNHGSADLSLRASLDGEHAMPAGQWGHLTAIRSETLPPATSAGHPIAHVASRGRLVGVCAMLEGHLMASLDSFTADALNFLEGDERMLVDGRRSLPGTGTEDYFDGAFYFDRGAASTAFAQHWGVTRDTTRSPAAGSASACRWHVLTGAIDFDTSLDANLEIGPGDPTLLDRYRTIAFVYE